MDLNEALCIIEYNNFHGELAFCVVEVAQREYINILSHARCKVLQEAENAILRHVLMKDHKDLDKIMDIINEEDPHNVVLDMIKHNSEEYMRRVTRLEYLSGINGEIYKKNHVKT